MRKIREVLRLKFEVGLSARQVAVSADDSPQIFGRFKSSFDYVRSTL